MMKIIGKFSVAVHRESYNFTRRKDQYFLDSSEIEVKMVTTLNKPSLLIHEIQLKKVEDWNLFKFSEPLQVRMECLLESKKADQITPDEISELEAIDELDRIFTHINAILATNNVNW